MSAAQYGQTESVRVLRQLGADVNARDKVCARICLLQNSIPKLILTNVNAMVWLLMVSFRIMRLPLCGPRGMATQRR